LGRRPDLLTRLKARDYERLLQTSAVDQLLGGEARARPQVGEVALHDAWTDAHETGCVLAQAVPIRRTVTLPPRPIGRSWVSAFTLA